jgi:hypothetical protein
MVGADVLQRVGDALDEIFLLDGGHVISATCRLSSMRFDGPEF